MNDLLAHLALATLLSSAALVLVLSLRDAMTRQFGAGIAYAAWALVPLSALATLLPARSVVLVVKAIPASTTAVAMSIGDIGAPSRLVSPSGGGLDAATWLCGFWIAGLAASFVVYLFQHRRFVRALGRIDPLAGDLHRAQTTQGCPALVGFWRPRIVLPLDFESRYGASERELILAHERHHRSRGDALANALATALRSVFWFNPLVHYAAACFMADQELACDAAVMARFPNARRAYAHAMLKAQAGGLRAALACQWTPRNLLAERIARLANPPVGRLRRWIGNAAVVAMILSGSVAAWASRPVETRTQYESAAPVEVAAARATDASDVPANGRGLVRSEAIGGHAASPPRNTPARKPPSPSHEPVSQAVAANPQRKPAPMLTRLATEQPIAASTKALADPVPAMTEPASGADRPAREIASYRRDHAPSYPAAAARAHIEGKVVLDVGVDENGSAVDARIASLEPSTATELASASLAAVTRWQFEPAQHGGRAVAGRIAVPFVFALSGDSAHAAQEPLRRASYRTVGSGAYPADLAGTEGVVYVRVRIENDGTVSSSEIDRVDPSSAVRLGPPALASLKTWTFEPARDRGKPVASTAIVPIVFSANARSSPSIARIRNSLDPVRIALKRS
jgi:TonB family protein